MNLVIFNFGNILNILFYKIECKILTFFQIIKTFKTLRYIRDLLNTKHQKKNHVQASNFNIILKSFRILGRINLLFLNFLVAFHEGKSSKNLKKQILRAWLRFGGGNLIRAKILKGENDIEVNVRLLCKAKFALKNKRPYPFRSRSPEAFGFLRALQDCERQKPNCQIKIAK